jgi:hypothetical protein
MKMKIKSNLSFLNIVLILLIIFIIVVVFLVTKKKIIEKFEIDDAVLIEKIGARVGECFGKQVVRLNNEELNALTVEKIKKWSLDKIIDTEEYIQKSNAYILFYLWMKKNRSWYTIGKEPYNIDEIVSIMPKTFDIDYTKLEPKIEEVFDKYLK